MPCLFYLVMDGEPSWLYRLAVTPKALAALLRWRNAHRAETGLPPARWARFETPCGSVVAEVRI